jgi:hypothetical protein
MVAFDSVTDTFNSIVAQFSDGGTPPPPPPPPPGGTAAWDDIAATFDSITIAFDTAGSIPGTGSGSDITFLTGTFIPQIAKTGTYFTQRLTGTYIPQVIKAGSYVNQLNRGGSP